MPLRRAQSLVPQALLVLALAALLAACGASAKAHLGTTARDRARLGDGAFWIHNQLWVLKGKVVLEFSADNEAHTQQLAGQVLKRLP